MGAGTSVARSRDAARASVATPPPDTFDVFLTAYDPSDLPGTSIDPLGFDRGYEFVAEKLLPALTNVGNTPRYFSVLCAGVYLAEVPDDASPRQQVERRRDAVLRLERLWALASVLAVQDQDVSLSGLRGVRYVNAEVARLRDTGARYANLGYRLLSRQAPTGALGVYGAVAASGLQRGELIQGVGDGSPLRASALAGLLRRNPGESIRLLVTNRGKARVITVSPMTTSTWPAGK